MLGGKGWWWSFPMLATCFDPSEVDYSGQVCGYSPGVEDEGSKRAEGWVFNITGLNHQSWNGCWRLGCMRSRYNIVSIKPSSMLYFCRNLIFLIEVALWLFWPRVWYTCFFFLSFSSVTQSDQMCLPEGQTLPLCLWQGECRISGVAHWGNLTAVTRETQNLGWCLKFGRVEPESWSWEINQKAKVWKRLYFKDSHVCEHFVNLVR